MILNSQSAQLIRDNAARLASCVQTKEDLTDLATAGTLEQVFASIESLLMSNPEMYFDDEILMMLDEANWRGMKATLLVYTLNMINRHLVHTKDFQKAPSLRAYDMRDVDGASVQP
jgi:hypothetical protein